VEQPEETGPEAAEEQEVIELLFLVELNLLLIQKKLQLQ
jgi:hypothetical protein